MKRYTLFYFTLLIALFAFTANGFAQYDDVYYNPDTDDYYDGRSSGNNSGSYDDNNARYEEGYDNGYDNGYDDYAYEQDEYYDYEYTSRVRRFHRPYYGFDYYDPIYVDLSYYDPYFHPWGATVLIYDSWGRPSYQRHGWGPAFNIGFGR